jgi:hypothetical protein
LLPVPCLPSSGEWHEIPAYTRARKVCEQQNYSGKSKDQSVVEVIDLDKEINAPCIEITGLGAVTWDFLDRPVILRYLSLHLRNMNKFLSFDVKVLDSSAKVRIFKISNRRSHCVISNETDDATDTEISVCELPLTIGPGWQMCCIDMLDLCKNAFGVTNPNIIGVTVHGNCRVSKIFFHNERCSDAEMPQHLRCIGS